MKQNIHIRGVDNLVEEINFIQNNRECQTVEYDIQFICCSCKTTEIETLYVENTEKNMYDSMEPVANWCIQYCFLYCQLFNLFFPVARRSSGPNNNHWRFHLNLSIP